jgi:hypothetical protein
MLGPISRLNLRACLCPCFASDEDRMTREALRELENLPIALYHSETLAEEPSESFDESIVTTVGKLATRLWKGKLVGTKRWKRSIGTLTVIDATKGPTLWIRYDGTDSGMRNKWILLRKISGVKECSSFLPVKYSGILLFGKKVKDADKDKTSKEKSTTEELLRFEVRDNQEDSKAASTDRRNEILEYIRTVAHWERKRWSYSGDDEDEDDETLQEEDGNEDDGDGKKVRRIDSPDQSDAPVQKKSIQEREKLLEEREIELQNRRTEREQRKARYLKEAGGLKYTAIIMANKS